LPKRQWPGWWQWDLELTPHLLKRMDDRRFTEMDLRAMLDGARSYRADAVPGRWVIEAPRGRRTWEIIVEPDADLRVLVIITAYVAG